MLGPQFVIEPVGGGALLEEVGSSKWTLGVCIVIISSSLAVEDVISHFPAAMCPLTLWVPHLVSQDKFLFSFFLF